MSSDRRIAIAAAVLLAACGAEPRAPAAGQPATRAHAAPTRRLVYVTDEGAASLSIIDAATDSVIATIPLGRRPGAVRAGPDGRVFVALNGPPDCAPTTPDARCSETAADTAGDGIALVNVAARRVDRVLPGGPGPEAFDVSADGKRLYVASGNTPTISIIEVASGRVLRTIAVRPGAAAVCLRPDGKELWVANAADHGVTIIGTDSGRVLGHVVVDRRPRAVAFAPDGRTAYVGGEAGSTLSIIDVATRVVRTVVRLPKGAQPMGIAVAPDGGRIYVTTGEGGTVLAVDAATSQVTASVAVGPMPRGIALTPDGRRLYTANGASNDVTVVDAATIQVLKRIPAGAMTSGAAIGTAPGPAAH